MERLSKTSWNDTVLPVWLWKKKVVGFLKVSVFCSFDSLNFWPVTLCLASPVFWGPSGLPGRRWRAVRGESGFATGIITEPFGR